MKTMLRTETTIYLVRRLFGGTPYVLEVGPDQWHLSDPDKIYVKPLDTDVLRSSVFTTAEAATASMLQAAEGGAA